MTETVFRRLRAALAGYDAQYGTRSLAQQHPDLPAGAADRVEALAAAARAVTTDPFATVSDEGPFDPDDLVRWAEMYGHPEGWAKRAQAAHTRAERADAARTILHDALAGLLIPARGSQYLLDRIHTALEEARRAG